MHKKVKEAIGIFKVSNNGRLHDKNNQIILDKHKKIHTWKNHVEELFWDDNKSEYQPELTATNNMPIMTEGIKKAISQIKNG